MDPLSVVYMRLRSITPNRGFKQLYRECGPGTIFYPLQKTNVMERDNKDDRKKIKEPFDPERTPEPAQVKHPTSKEEREKTKGENKPSNEDQQKKQPAPEKRLGESPIEIDDETTI